MKYGVQDPLLNYDTPSYEEDYSDYNSYEDHHYYKPKKYHKFKYSYGKYDTNKNKNSYYGKPATEGYKRKADRFGAWVDGFVPVDNFAN